MRHPNWFRFFSHVRFHLRNVSLYAISYFITYDFPHSTDIIFIVIEFFISLYFFYLFLYCLVITSHILVPDLFDIFKAIITHVYIQSNSTTTRTLNRRGGPLATFCTMSSSFTSLSMTSSDRPLLVCKSQLSVSCLHLRGIPATLVQSCLKTRCSMSPRISI